MSWGSVATALLIGLGGCASTTAVPTDLPPADAPYLLLETVTPTEHSTRLDLTLVNPTGEEITFNGYAADSFDPPLAEGRIAPVHRVEVRDGDDWSSDDPSFCGVGMGEQGMPARSQGSFSAYVDLTAGTTRVGVSYVQAGRAETAWSRPISDS